MKGTVSTLEICPDLLHQEFEHLSPRQRLARLYEYFEPEEVLVTSSFGAHSALLLSLISQVKPGQTVYFINTTYHFPETLAYKQQLTDLMGLQVLELLPEPSANARSLEEQWWISQSDRCCQVNKVLPLQAIQPGHQVWISGLMGFQNQHRAQLPVFEKRGGIVKFQPLIDLSGEDFEALCSDYDLPTHPLEAKGYGSVGCTHCTIKGEGRSGRWAGTAKTECGLHIQPIEK